MSKDNAEVLGKLDHLTALVAAKFESVQAQLIAQGERIARMEGRLDEQSRILSAMVPTTLAAVPPRSPPAGKPPASRGAA